MTNGKISAFSAYPFSIRQSMPQKGDFVCVLLRLKPAKNCILHHSRISQNLRLTGKRLTPHPTARPHFWFVPVFPFLRRLKRKVLLEQKKKRFAKNSSDATLLLQKAISGFRTRCCIRPLPRQKKTAVRARFYGSVKCRSTPKMSCRCLPIFPASTRKPPLNAAFARFGRSKPGRFLCRHRCFIPAVRSGKP